MMTETLWTDFAEILLAVTDRINTPACWTVWGFWLIVTWGLNLYFARKKGGER
ncbi:MAG: hypothetical protein HDS74_06325 [Bacteroidales bacterium]|nr:hypothetical protein [Bacteroidales bacterium]MBD5212694.1 hypothetical protein [Bacteroidales bacterium]MBD5217284.1 hypothetical protein [Bacteroidales bacterium]